MKLTSEFVTMLPALSLVHHARAQKTALTFCNLHCPTCWPMLILMRGRRRMLPDATPQQKEPLTSQDLQLMAHLLPTPSTQVPGQ